MPGALTSSGEAPPVPASFEAALARLPDGYVDGNFGGRAWGVTVKRSQDGKRIWLYGQELGGTVWRSNEEFEGRLRKTHAQQEPRLSQCRSHLRDHR